MDNLRNYIGQELQWRHPKFLKPDYELHTQDTIVLHIHRQGYAGNQALVEADENRWLLDRRGFRKKFFILDPQTQAEVATIKGGISGKATVLFPDGREYKWQSMSFWRSTWGWFTSEDVLLIQQKRGARVELTPNSQDVPEIALLVALGWYLTRLAAEDASSTAYAPVT
ncbi:hypothetical protein [Tengunoibacter tsumagoiensis]|uniref:Uncharacterized protein n=1 Tax=Tengunoibacter tsumagoiensis TaxID=2014871 RepID=A0A402AAF7_9CHLR|nr:hypothetical protein [Tengunoibacter tsumagoiensis]GCE15935.1 hypothetical protein KTT_57940 [Tengunoibacter tsumagoiensis]